uniref:Uncharacterized protein n=1 Tax=Arion vulgaris TaxID=1028688 RepID=A0A0B6ZTH5_9EUPU
MNMLLTNRASSYLILVALLCCIFLLFVPSIKYLQSKNGKLYALNNPTAQPNYRTSTTEGNVDNISNEDMEFHARQGGSSKLDFNRLALEDKPAAGPDVGLAMSIERSIVQEVVITNSSLERNATEVNVADGLRAADLESKMRLINRNLTSR